MLPITMAVLGFSRVRASIGHGEKAGLVVPQLEVLIGKLLAVDGLAAGALGQLAWTPNADRELGDSHVAAGKVTTLEHEVRDDAVEAGAVVAEAVLASAELPKVAGGLRDNVVEEVEGDAALLLDCCITTVSGWSESFRGGLMAARSLRGRAAASRAGREKHCSGGIGVEARYLLFSLLTFWKVSSTAGPTHLTSKKLKHHEQRLEVAGWRAVQLTPETCWRRMRRKL